MSFFRKVIDEGHRISCSTTRCDLHGFVNIGDCRNPTLAKCGGEAQHLERVGIGVVATLAFGLRLRQGG